MDISEITTVQQNGNTLNVAKLPKIQYFRVQVQGVTGKKGERHATGYLVLVKCEGENELVNAPDIAARHGMRLKHNSFRTREAAIAGGKEYADKWGKATSAAGRRVEAKSAEAVKKALEEALAKMVALGMNEETAKKLLGL